MAAPRADTGLGGPPDGRSWQRRGRALWRWLLEALKPGPSDLKGALGCGNRYPRMLLIVRTIRATEMRVVRNGVRYGEVGAFHDNGGDRGLRSLQERVGVAGHEIAQLVGSSRETINKALSDFAQRGWIRQQGRTTWITDPAKLARRARM